MRYIEPRDKGSAKLRIVLFVLSCFLAVTLLGCGKSDKDSMSSTSEIDGYESANSVNYSQTTSSYNNIPDQSEQSTEPGNQESQGDSSVNQLQNPELETQNVGAGFFFTTIARSMEELIEVSDAIVIGTVGEELARELVDLPNNYSEEDLAEMKADGVEPPNLYKIFRRLHIEELLKGTEGSEIVLSHDRVDEGVLIDSPHFTLDQRLLLFLQEGGGKSYSYKSFDTYYFPISLNNGVFDIEGDLALARSTNPFLEDEGFVWDGVVTPYFHLDKIRANIEDFKGNNS